MVHEIIEGKNVTGSVEIRAGVDDIGSRDYGFQDFHDDAADGKKLDGSLEKSRFVRIDERFGGASKCLQVEEHRGINDDAARGILAGLENVLRAAAEKQFVAEDIEPAVKDRLASDESFVQTHSFEQHSMTCCEAGVKRCSRGELAGRGR
jgi:hypothetical protein